MIRLHVQDPGRLAERLHLGRRVVEPQRAERRRLHDQLAGQRVVDLVVARRPLDERDLLGIAAVVDQGGSGVGEPQVAVQRAGDLVEVGGRAGIELARQHLVVQHPHGGQQEREDRGVERGELRAQRQRLHGGASVSM